MHLQRELADSAGSLPLEEFRDFFQTRRVAVLLIVAAFLLSLVATLLPPLTGNSDFWSMIRSISVGSASVQSEGIQADPTQGLPIEIPTNKDLGLLLYRNPATNPKVVDFYTELAGSPDIAAIILKVANHYNVPLSLAFALAWKESKFSPGAVNFNGGSVDRGLYQLNSLSFPGIKSDDFFNPEINAEKGLSYLAQCLKEGGNEIAGLAMYNAGMSRVAQDGTPWVTLDYISTTLKYQNAVLTEFRASLLQQADVLKVVKSSRQAS